ncbi:U3 small nucleolar ribonucleoprotein complex, subunit Mpp10 [Gloeopeniophorella convolvens]|nr:U3 small nucleolar ribonucleoprotein complex, subunit Mpp10 [Gloeopeniophorella convolvens]
MASNLEPSLPPSFHRLSSLIDGSPESFAVGDAAIRDAALRATEYAFNLALNSEGQAQPHISALLASFNPTQAPVTRSQSSASGKRKRSSSPPPSSKSTFQSTSLSSLYVHGLDKDQIWAQLELRAQHICKMLEHALDGTEEASGNALTEADGDEDSVGTDGDDASLPSGGSDEDTEMGEDEDTGSGEEASEEGIANLRDASSDDEDDVGEERVLPLSSSSSRKRSAGRSELDDGFFDLAQFNAETEEAEATFVSSGALGEDSDEGSDDDEVDYFMPVDGKMQDDGNLEPRYSDFFDVPPSKNGRKESSDRSSAAVSSKVRFHDEVKVKTIKARGKGLPVSTLQLASDAFDDEDDSDIEGVDKAEGYLDGDSDAELSDEDGQDEEESDEDDLAFGDSHQTIERLKDDLLADEEEPDDGLSTHEKRQASLQQQIAALEAENVSKKDWTLMGEATSRARPHNSLLEEDLEFERVMKAIPVITEETVAGLEDRIKARILEGRFDDVVRRRAVDDKPFLPSRVFELQDTKSKQSLAQIYEDEYVAAQTGGVAGEDRDGKLRKEHEDITRLWESISLKLDALSNAHFTPKAPTATISTVSNVASASLESALPTSNTAASMLAPEEVFERPASEPRARGELSPGEKKAVRNKLKKAKKKARDGLENSVDKFARPKGSRGVEAQKEAALRSIVKGGKGVTVVGKEKKTKGSTKHART